MYVRRACRIRDWARWRLLHSGAYQAGAAVFEADEQKALLHAAAFAREAGYPSEEPLNRAVSKIKRYTNPEQLERLERHESSIEAIHPPTASSLTRILHEIEAGIDRQSSLEIDYATGYDGITQPRILDPYGLVH